MVCNKYLTFLFLEDNDPISAKSAAQLLSLNLAQTLLFLIFQLLVDAILQIVVH